MECLTYEVFQVNSKMFTSNNDPCSWWPFSWRDPSNDWRRSHNDSSLHSFKSLHFPYFLSCSAILFGSALTWRLGTTRDKERLVNLLHLSKRHYVFLPFIVVFCFITPILLGTLMHLCLIIQYLTEIEI